MAQSIVRNDDIKWLKQHTPQEITMIVGQMTSLLEAIADTKNDTDAKVAKIQDQGWFKRLWSTITGRNKATKEEIRRNQDKIVGYISQAVAKLFELNLIEMQAIQSLGNRINQIYAQLTEVYNEQLQMKAQIAEIQNIQQETIKSLGEIANDLDEKIESIDNFHMLTKEIEQGKYQNKSRIYSMCSILAQLDKRTINDDRKMEILKVDLQRFDIATLKKVSIQDLIMEILSLSEKEVGSVYLELSNYGDAFPANILVDSIEEYHFLSKLEKLSKKKKTIIDSILNKYELEGNASFSYSVLFEELFENKAGSFISLTDLLGISQNNASNQYNLNITNIENEINIGAKSCASDYNLQNFVIGPEYIVDYTGIVKAGYKQEVIQSEPFIGIKILCKDIQANAMSPDQRISQIDEFLKTKNSMTGLTPLSGTRCFLRETKPDFMIDGFLLITLPVPRSELGVQIQNLIRAVQMFRRIDITQMGYVEINVSGRCPMGYLEPCLNNLMIPDDYMTLIDQPYNSPYRLGKVERINEDFICFRSSWKLNPDDLNLYQKISTIALLISAMFK